MVTENEALVQQASEPTQAEITFDSQHAIRKADAIIKALDSVIKLALQRTNSNDWKLIGKGYYLQESGAMKIRPIFGIYFRDLTVSKETNDDGSLAFTAQVTCGATVLDKWYGTEATIEQIGTRSTSDEFFCGKDGKKQFDVQDVKKAAIANCRGRAIVALLGLQNMTADDLKRQGVNVQGVQGVAFKTGAKGGSVVDGTDKEIQVKLYNTMVKITGSSAEKDLKKLLLELTTFTGKDGKQVSGVDSLNRLTGKRLQVTYGKAQSMLEEMGETVSDEIRTPGQEG